MEIVSQSHIKAEETASPPATSGRKKQRRNKPYVPHTIK
jgi:hypothetical protein